MRPALNVAKRELVSISCAGYTPSAPRSEKESYFTAARVIRLRTML
jgi:hypothetical protein